jgi:membrane protease YdiL (CAAX protease family)
VNGPNLVAALVGLAVAWGGTALLVSPAGRLLGDPEQIATKLLGQLALWTLFASVLGVVIFWEQQPLGSLWLQSLGWQSVAWGLAFTAFTLWLVIPAREWVRRSARLPGYRAGATKVIDLPLWFRVVAVITAGVVEETLFHGYAVTRLILLTGSVWLAGTLAVTAFASLHFPFWGAGPVLAFLVGDIVSTAFFIWRQDLLAMIVAHCTIDAWGLIVSPLYSEWWKERRFS